jgi:N-6 DNA Methylase
MQPLERSLRSKLDRTIQNARDIAEVAARATLEQLGVKEAAPFAFLAEEERELRRKLRAHGRQLGDVRDSSSEVQEIDRLVEEVAYEHWHRMLFARFLAENGLLMYWPEGDDEPIDIDLATCQDLIDEGAEQAASKWELASRCAARMLPQIFRPDSPVFRLTLPTEYQQKLEELVAGLPLEVFIAADSLGWVYQFWQAKKKEEVNAAEIKIGARELPAVTQLFTEPYMVSFLLDNSLGAWWAARRLSKLDFRQVASEEELRAKAAISGVPLKYLRFVQQEDGAWTPASGTFSRWPEQLKEIKTLDPCCGSGHFLVAAFLMLVPMRMEVEGLSAAAAVDAVLRENIHGLEIDQRCVEIAAFALALTAWRYPDAGGYRALPELNVACSGLSVSMLREEWKQMATGKHNLKISLGWIYDVFENAPVLGSLLNPARAELAKLVKWEELAQLLAQGLAQGEVERQDEMGVVAQGLAKAATLLADRYQWVITNVPYLARGKQNHVLQEFSQKYYREAKNDLATVFLERCLEFCVEGGTTTVVLPQNWLFLGFYKKFREKLLKNDTWNLIARMGAKAFQTPMWDFNVQLIILSRGNAYIAKGLFASGNRGNMIHGLDVSEPRTATEKATQLLLTDIKEVEQAKQLDNPDARVAFEEIQGELLEKYALAYIGQRSGDGLRFIRFFWELNSISTEWEFFGTTVNGTSLYSGNTQLLLWEKGKGQLANYQSELARTQYASGGWKQGWQAWGIKGVRVSQMRVLPVTIHCGSHFDNNSATIIPHTPSHLPAIWCFCSSPEYHDAVRQIDQSLKVTNATLVKVPFDLAYWTQIAQEKYPNGLPKTYSNDPTQWIFHGNPAYSDDPLQVAVARLLGYHWPPETDSEMELADEARALVQKSQLLNVYADEDGIVCIPPVRGEASASDRLVNLLAAAYGDAWNSDTLSQLLKQANYADKSLETWLREKFFTQHCKLFQHRPFIWQIWDGLRDGFAVLVNYHKLDTKLLETLIYTYLGDWIARQLQDKANGIDGAEEKIAAAETLKKRLELILLGEQPYDIFVRWKPIEKQPIGWNPDLNDGVRLNIRPFLSVPDVGKTGAGVLRDKPNINWNKDRGKDVASAPWYGTFGGDRINDHHLSLEEKKAAQQAKP